METRSMTDYNRIQQLVSQIKDARQLLPGTISDEINNLLQRVNTICSKSNQEIDDLLNVDNWQPIANKILLTSSNGMVDLPFNRLKFEQALRNLGGSQLESLHILYCSG